MRKHENLKFVNVSMETLPKPGKRWAKQFFLLHQDTCANVIIVGSLKARSCMTNLRPAAEGDTVMMNSHPAPVKEYGDLHVEVFDDCDRVGTR